MDKFCIRSAFDEDFNQLRELWEICFPEAPEFNDFFFERMYSENAVRLISDSGKVLAALYVFPYSFVNCNLELNGYYIYGVGTHPKMRGRGLAGMLLGEVIKEARDHGMDFCALVPQNQSLFEFYKKFGFTPAFAFEEELRQVPQETKTNLRKAKHQDIACINSVYENVFSDTLHIKRSYKEWCLLIDEFDLSGGGIYLIEDNGSVVGYATFARENGKANISELACKNQADAEHLLQGIAKAESASEINLIKRGKGEFYGSVYLLSDTAKEYNFENAYMNLMHS